MPEYTLAIRNNKIKFYNRFGGFIILINILSTAFVALSTGQIPTLFIVFLSMNAVILFFHLWFRNSIYRFGLHPYFIIGGMFWLLAGFIPVFILLFAFELLHMTATKEPVVVVSNDRISYPSLFTRTAKWEQLNNLILKDGIVTIDFKNNKLIQQPIDENKTYINEKEFNEFCRQQLNK